MLAPHCADPLLSARRGEGKIHAHSHGKYFLKFEFVRTFVVPIRDGSVIYKYKHCSGEYCLLFRSVRPNIPVDVPPPKCSREGNHWELKAKHARHLVLVKHYPDGEIVKVTKFAEDVKEKMMNEELPITKQQKVKLG